MKKISDREFFAEVKRVLPETKISENLIRLIIKDLCKNEKKD